MRWLDGVLIAFGVVNILGGLGGYFTAGSMMSLLGGVGTGIVVIGGAALAKSHPAAGYGIATLGTLAVGGMMFRRYLETHKVMPALMLTILSVVVLICLVVGHYATKKSA